MSLGKHTCVIGKKLLCLWGKLLFFLLGKHFYVPPIEIGYAHALAGAACCDVMQIAVSVLQSLPYSKPVQSSCELAPPLSPRHP